MTTTTATVAPPDPGAIAAEVIAAIVKAYAGDDRTLIDARCFADLHDECDANEFLLAGLAAVGWAPDWTNDAHLTRAGLALDQVDPWIAAYPENPDA